MSHFKIVADAVNQAAKREADEHEQIKLNKLWDNLPDILERRALEGSYATTLYDFEAVAHWWYNRPKTPDFRWEMMQALKARAAALGVKADIDVRYVYFSGLHSFSLVLSW